MDSKKKVDVFETRKIMLDILNDVTEFCDKNSITYFLACGTLLGAIKYNGFIPWDDDIDIMMPRDDFERFNREYINGKYALLTPNDGLFFYSKAYDKNTVVYEKNVDYKKYKSIGIDIDIFPLDGIINDKRIIEKQKRKSYFLESLLSLSKQPIFNRKNPIKAINRIIARIIGSKSIIKLIEKNAKKYSYNDSDYVIRYKKTSNGFTGALPKSCYYIEKHIFEGKYYNVPIGYDLWLTRFYGDGYKENEPSKEKQKSHERDIFYA